MTKHKRKQARTLTSDSRGRITGAVTPDTDYRGQSPEYIPW